MKSNISNHHKADTWARVSTPHGQTLLSLAFNYCVLSLMTLTFGTKSMDIELEDIPSGCFGELPEKQKVEMVQMLMMRDFKEGDGPTTFKSAERVCHEIIVDQNGYGKFTDWCCYMDSISGVKTCENSNANEWLQFLYVLLGVIRFGVLFFGPIMFFSAVGSLAREEVPYTVKLKEPLVRTVMMCQPDSIIDEDIKVKQYLDLHSRRFRDLPKLVESMHNVEMKLPPTAGSLQGAIGQPMEVKISEYDIMVNYKRLLTENKVPIGLWKTIIRAIFYCKLRNVGPFVDCCKQNMFRHQMCSCVRTSVPWIKFWRKVGVGLLVVLLPTPYYIRLFIFYNYECEEVMARKEAVARLGLQESFENSLVHYLLPTHPLFICIYLLYGVMAITLAYMARRTEEGRFRKILVGAFTDLKHLSWIDVLNMMVSNIIWPFKKYGAAGLLVIFVYWPVALPITFVVYVFYCLPTIYLTIRMFFYSKRAFLEKIHKRTRRSYRVRRKVDNSLHLFVMENIYKLLWGEDDDDVVRRRKDLGNSGVSLRRQRSNRLSDGYELDEVDNLNPIRLQRFRSVSVASTIISSQTCNWRHVLEHIFASSLCVVALYSVLIILSECIGCLVEIMVFTMMGIIVNAGTLLKYIALFILVIVYSYDCFNNVEKKYLKLNKALFNEVKSRIKDLEKVTSLPSYLQENRGFKSQELSEQAEYEMQDDIVDKPARHWFINDLVLFIDNEDMPRIPRKLFEDVCQIRVAGVPGPVYLGLLFALKQFLKIAIFVLFIFLVILSFGNVYGLSSTNSMIAALAGGSLPLILRTFMEPEKPDIEMGTVSFKSKLDEIIKNFAQYWPIYDFSFELHVPEEEKEATERDGSVKYDEKADNDTKPTTDIVFQCHVCSDDTDSSFGNVVVLDSEQNVVSGLTPVKTNSVARLPSTASSRVVADDEQRKKEVGFGGLAPGKTNSVARLPSTASSRIVADDEQRKKEVGFGGGKDGGVRVCFQEEPPHRDVDILIWLPSRYDEIWLDEWSDFGNDTVNTNIDDVFDNRPKVLNI